MLTRGLVEVSRQQREVPDVYRLVARKVTAEPVPPGPIKIYRERRKICDIDSSIKVGVTQAVQMRQHDVILVKRRRITQRSADGAVGEDNPLIRHHAQRLHRHRLAFPTNGGHAGCFQFRAASNASGLM